MSRWPCKDYFKGTCFNSLCEKGHPPECLFYKTKNGCRFEEKYSYAHRQIDEQTSKRSQKNDDKSAVVMLTKHELHDGTGQLVVIRDKSQDWTGQSVVNRDTRRVSSHGSVQYRSSKTLQLECVFQDMGPPKLTSILRKSSDMQKPIQRLKFTKTIARHTKIRYKNPSLGLICPGKPHQRSPNAPKFEDRSQEETAREAAWKLPKSVLKFKEHQRAAFFSPSENWCLPASTLKPEEREFVVDSRVSIRMISKKGRQWCWNEFLDEIV